MAGGKSSKPPDIFLGAKVTGTICGDWAGTLCGLATSVKPWKDAPPLGDGGTKTGLGAARITGDGIGDVSARALKHPNLPAWGGAAMMTGPPI